MSNSIIRTEKHKSIGSLKSRMTHTYRTRPTENADPTKLHLNKLLAGTENYATALEAHLKAYEEAGNKVRDNGVLAIEYLLSASPEFFTDCPIYERQQRLDDWSASQVAFMEEKHGKENILAMVLHLDEKTPHIECFVVPIDQRGKLNCRFYLGGAKKMSLLQTEYAEWNSGFGLKRGKEGSTATHTTVKQFYNLINTSAKITTADVIDSVKLTQPSLLERVDISKWIAQQEKRIRRNLTKLFAPIIYENKLLPLAKKIIEDTERMTAAQEKKEYQHEKEIEAFKEQVMKQAMIIDLVEHYKTENTELKAHNATLTAELKKLKVQVPPTPSKK